MYFIKDFRGRNNKQRDLKRFLSHRRHNLANLSTAGLQLHVFNSKSSTAGLQQLIYTASSFVKTGGGLYHIWQASPDDCSDVDTQCHNLHRRTAICFIVPFIFLFRLLLIGYFICTLYETKSIKIKKNYEKICKICEIVRYFPT